MKRNMMLGGLMVSAAALGVLTQSCVSDTPFDNGNGMGSLRMQLVVNSDITRAEVNDEDLKSGCVVYISGKDGLLHQYEGISNVPDEIPMKSGNYVAEAWTGDSVPASFTDKFYRGFERFSIENGSRKAITLTCKIANVVVSVDESTIDPDYIRNWKVTVSNSSGSLDFDADNVAEAKGYFMMPDKDIAVDPSNGEIRRDNEGWSYYTNLSYTVEGENAVGQPFTAKGFVSSPVLGDNLVEHAHEYILKFKYDKDYEGAGGSLISIEIEDENLVTDVIGLYSRPSLKGVGFNLDRQIEVTPGNAKEQVVRIAGFNGLKSILVSSNDYEALGFPKDARGNYYDSFDIMNLAPDVDQEIKAMGLNWSYEEPAGENKPYVSYLRLTPSFLNNLQESENEYQIKLHVEDGNGRVNDAVIRLAVGEGAIVEEDPVSLNSLSGNYLAVRATKVTVSGTINNPDADDLKLVYRQVGSESWQETAIISTRASDTFEITLTGLTPETLYEVAGKSGDVLYGRQEFTTEQKYQIPEGDMNTWGIYNNNVKFPGTDYANQTWDSGNHGSAAMGKTLTESASNIFHEGTSAKLSSQFVGVFGFGKFAAGNLFIGKFGKTVSTDGAILDFGKPYNGSHPDALKVWVHYTPAKVGYTDSKVSELKKGDPDQGQIYVAFATQPASLNTASGIYFDPDADYILGYGEKTWKDGATAGNGNNMEEVTIDVKWREGAKTKKPVYLIIVCSASKYGDYFVGGDGSVMYLDDFELVY